MGAAGGGPLGCSGSPAGELLGWHTTLATGSEGKALEAEVQRAGGSREAQVPDGLGRPATAPRAGGVWQVYYDSAAFNLCCRGWWLLESGDAWMLHMPKFAADPEGLPGGVKLLGYEQVLGDAEILEKIGLVEHSKAMREGWPTTMQALLAQAGVVPFARLRVEQQLYSCCWGPGGLAPRQGREAASSACTLHLSFSHLELDAQYGENGAVADLLFSQGSRARAALRLAVVQLRPEVFEESSGRIFESFLVERGLRQPFSTGPVPPHLAACLKVLRPTLLRTLRNAAVVE